MTTPGDEGGATPPRSAQTRSAGAAFPAAPADAPSATPSPAPAAIDGAGAGEGDLAGLRVLIVEDEALIGMMLQDMVEDLGMSVAASALNRADALLRLGDAEFDLAILDVNLAGESSAPVAERLVALGKPFLFSTGYDSRRVTGFDGVEVVSKPYEMRRLEEALRLTAARANLRGDGAGG